MLKVYIPSEYWTPVLGVTRHHDLPFEFEKDKFVITHSVEEADIIPVIPSKSKSVVEEQVAYLGNISNNQLILLMMHTHIHDADTVKVLIEHKFAWKKYTHNVKVLHLNSNLAGYRNGIYYDYCFNQVKAYFTEYDKFDLSNRLWSASATKAMFTLSDIARKPPHRTFLSPNRVSLSRKEDRRNALREELHKFIPPHTMWRGDPESGYVLYSQEITPLIMDSLATGGWAPVADAYYQNSFVSVYVETITFSKKVFGRETKALTEKTYTALIKGHFILPYGYRGMIKDIQAKGFLLPSWIDYSYDDLDDDERFDGFKNSINDLLRYSEQELMEFFEQDKYILEHNRNLFFTMNYDSLYEKLLNKLAK